MECPKCGFENPDSFKFCGECAHPLMEKAELSSVDAPTESERKHVTIMFSDLSGYTAMTEKLDPEDVKEIMNQIFGEITRIIKKYDGFIERFIGDAVMAVFGIPKAHEDDPTRAIRAAMEIHTAVENFSPQYKGKIGSSLTMHTGINTGLVVTGQVDVQKGTHGLTGDAINLASRLEGIAKAGDIVVGPDTYRQALSCFEFEALEPVKVKGKKDPISVYKLISILERHEAIHCMYGVQASLVGRETEMDFLLEAVENLKQSKGSIISIVGHAGTGKSRLVREFKAKLSPEEIQWHEGHAYPYTTNMAYYPLNNLLTYAFRIRENDKPDQVREKVEKGLQTLLWDKPEAKQYIGSLFSLSYPEIDGVSPDYWRDQLKKSVQQILEAVASRGPTVILFEDLHWSDGAFIELLHLLLRNVQRPVLFLCIYRPIFSLFPNGEPEALAWPHYKIDLRELPWDKTEEMLRSLLNSTHLPDELSSFIKEKVEGNPFYLEEVINTLIETETLVPDNGKWKLSGTLDLKDIPTSIQGVLTARLDRLEKQAKRILQEASVIGRAFFYKVLTRITALSPPVDRYLAGLESLDLIRARSRAPDLEYIFKHALTQEVVYHGLLKKERQEIHESIGLAIEQLFQDRLPEFYEILAHHFQKGRSTDKAVTYLVKVGDKCLAKFALNESNQAYQGAYELLLANPQQWRDWDITLIKLLNRWSFVLYFQSNWSGGQRLLSKHEEITLNIKDRAITAMYYAWLGWFYLGIEEYQKGEKFLLKALKIGKEIQDQKIIAYVYTWYSWTLTTLGRCDEAIEYGKKAIKLAVDFDLDIYIHFKSRAGVAQAYWYRGDRLKSLDEGRKLVEFGRSRGSIPAITFGYLEIGASYTSDGDFSEAIQWLDRIVSEQKEFIYYHSALCVQGMAYFLSGEYGKAESAIKNALNYLLEDSRFPWLCTPGELYLGGVMIARGSMKAGMKMLLKARERSLKTGYKYIYVISEYMLGKVFLMMTLGEGDIAFGTILRNIGFLIKHLPFAKTKAESHFKKTILLADEIGAKNFKGLALFDLGQLYRHKKRKEEAREFLMQAIEVFELCGIETYKRQAETVLGSLI
jgi:class 3 adenylate cyclase/tetratricopeptide (TPR) repeat protein/energy-coupling factor transporter ATP-binding protein EcfA2